MPQIPPAEPPAAPVSHRPNDAPAPLHAQQSQPSSIGRGSFVNRLFRSRICPRPSGSASDDRTNAFAFRPFRVGSTQSNMSTPAHTAATMSCSYPTPIRYRGLPSGISGAVCRTTRAMSSACSPTATPPIAYPGTRCCTPARPTGPPIEVRPTLHDPEETLGPRRTHAGPARQRSQHTAEPARRPVQRHVEPRVVVVPPALHPVPHRRLTDPRLVHRPRVRVHAGRAVIERHDDVRAELAAPSTARSGVRRYRFPSRCS
jgi:hypothetical protein